MYTTYIQKHINKPIKRIYKTLISSSVLSTHTNNFSLNLREYLNISIVVRMSFPLFI